MTCALPARVDPEDLLADEEQVADRDGRALRDPQERPVRRSEILHRDALARNRDRRVLAGDVSVVRKGDVPGGAADDVFSVAQGEHVAFGSPFEKLDSASDVTGVRATPDRFAGRGLRGRRHPVDPDPLPSHANLAAGFELAFLEGDKDAVHRAEILDDELRAVESEHRVHRRDEGIRIELDLVVADRGSHPRLVLEERVVGRAGTISRDGADARAGGRSLRLLSPRGQGSCGARLLGRSGFRHGSKVLVHGRTAVGTRSSAESRAGAPRKTVSGPTEPSAEGASYLSAVGNLPALCEPSRAPMLLPRGP